VSRAAHAPERLRATGATDLERRLLDAAAEEELSPELRDRMARAIGVSGAALAGSGANTKPVAAHRSPPVAGGAGPLLRWVSAGMATVAVAGAVVAVRARGAGPAGPPRISPVVAVPAPSSPPSTSPTEGPPPAATVDAVPLGALPAASRRGRAEAPVDDIAGQIALVDAARGALADGASDRALEILGQYQSRYPAGSFRPEATALRIEALVRVGRSAEARALAERFAAEHRGSPLANRIMREVGLSPR
jgi:hypothetical protein